VLHGSGDPHPTSHALTLGDLAADRDAERFVGRGRLLAEVRAAISDSTVGAGSLGGARVLFLHGPGGVGKSAVLRAMARHAVSSGIAVVTLDARDLVRTARSPTAGATGRSTGHPAGGPQPDPPSGGPTPNPDDPIARPIPVDRFTDWIGPVPGSALVTIDCLESIGPDQHGLTDAICRAVPASAFVVVASRQRPDRHWTSAMLEHLVIERLLDPLDHGDAVEMARRFGIDDDQVDAIVDRSAGYPLMIATAADLASPHHPRSVAQNRGVLRGSAQQNGGGTAFAAATPLSEVDHAIDDPLAATIIERLGGDELGTVDPAVLEVAAIAAAVDPRLFAAALPGRRTRDAMTELRATTLVDSVGNRLTLHPLLRDALRSRLLAVDPDRYRGLVLRIAAHLRSRALTDDVRLVLEMADLVEDADVRLGWAPSRTHVADRLRPGDTPTIRRAVRDSPWGPRMDRWLRDDPGSVLVVRDRITGEAVTSAVVNRSDRLPEWAEEDEDLGPMIAHARRLGRLDRSSFLHKVVVLCEQPPDDATMAEIIRVGNSGMVSRGLAGSVRYGYATDVVRRAVDGTAALGYQRVAELDRTDGAHTAFTLVTDFGPDGIAGTMDALIRSEQGDVELGPDGGEHGGGGGTDLAIALRSFHDDAALAALAIADLCPDAAEVGVPGRAAFVRDRVRAAVDAAFAGDTDDDVILRRAVERTYLDPDGGHARARQELHMSRSSYFRHLARARDRVAQHNPPGR